MENRTHTGKLNAGQERKKITSTNYCTEELREKERKPVFRTHKENEMREEEEEEEEEDT